MTSGMAVLVPILCRSAPEKRGVGQGMAMAGHNAVNLPMDSFSYYAGALAFLLAAFFCFLAFFFDALNSAG